MFGKGDRSHMPQWNVFLITLPNGPFVFPYFLTEVCLSHLLHAVLDFFNGTIYNSIALVWKKLLDSSFEDLILYVSRVGILSLHLFSYACQCFTTCVVQNVIRIVGYLVIVPAVCSVFALCVIPQRYVFFPFFLPFCCYCIFWGICVREIFHFLLSFQEY